MHGLLKDQLTTELDQYLKSKYPKFGVRVIYEKIEESGDPDEGPSVYEIGLPNSLITVLEKRGIRRLYKFQYEAYKRILDGYNVIIVAGTGTGKTEAFFIPLAKKILEKEASNPQCLLLYPTKALARDQIKRFLEYLTFGKLSIGIYDGDVSPSIRRKIAASPPSVIVTNPDMLHVGLVYSPYVEGFVKKAEAMVFDELHVYEGVLGAHLHHLVKRIELTKGEKIQFIAASATIGNPREFAENIFEEEFVEVYGSLKRKGTAVHILVSAGYASRLTVLASIAKFLADNDLRFILFVDSQQLAEILASIIERQSVEVAVHRAGLSYEVRRNVEQKLREGSLQGVVSTPTLELGIDIGVLDAVLLASSPPSFVKYLQRAGRAGRRKKGYIITVLGDDPIDSYYTKDPAAFFNRELTASFIEPLNEEVSKAHLIAHILRKGRENLRLLPIPWRSVVENLVSEGLIVKSGSYISPIYRLARKYFSEKSSIRSPGELIEVIEVSKGELLTTRELPIAILELYPGATYFYSKKPYEVIGLDIENKKAYLRPLEGSISTYSRPLHTVNVIDYVIHEEKVSGLGLEVVYAKVLVEDNVYGYLVKDIYGGEVLYTRKFDEPITYRFATRALLTRFPSLEEFDLLSSAEAFHAIEHAIISASRIVCGAGLTDLGGISYPSGDIVIYDAVVGGSGISKLLYTKFDKTVKTAFDIIRKCDCDDGCPRCIYDPYCGNNNRILSRKKALYVLSNIVSRKPLVKLHPLEDRYGDPIV
ncbi:MAG: DEAD/DEAH box helicase [Candidatus Geothermarchaeota archaeon]